MEVIIISPGPKKSPKDCGLYNEDQIKQIL